MRAAVLEAAGQPPTVRDFNEPTRDVVQVSLAGCNPVDLALASGEMGDPEVPAVVGKEGVGYTIDGTRVYFNSPMSPFGSWAELAQFNPDRTFEVPATVGDDLAVALGIAGLAAWLPLTRHADVSAGQSVLILGATGVVGNIAVQAAKILGAGRVVGAGRSGEGLQRARELGADAVVEIGGDDDAGALKAEIKDGYDVVVDMVYGEPFLAALEASAVGATPGHRRAGRRRCARGAVREAHGANSRRAQQQSAARPGDASGVSRAGGPGCRQAHHGRHHPVSTR